MNIIVNHVLEIVISYQLHAIDYSETYAMSKKEKWHPSY